MIKEHLHPGTLLGHTLCPELLNTLLHSECAAIPNPQCELLPALVPYGGKEAKCKGISCITLEG